MAQHVLNKPTLFLLYANLDASLHANLDAEYDAFLLIDALHALYKCHHNFTCFAWEQRFDSFQHRFLRGSWACAQDVADQCTKQLDAA